MKCQALERGFKMKKTDVKFYEEEASRICVEWNSEDCNYTYCEALTMIFNNVRVSERLISVTNDSRFCIYVSCLKEHEADVREWLSQFGAVQESVSILVLIPTGFSYDYNKYEDCIFLSK